MASYDFEISIEPGADGLPAGDVVGVAEVSWDRSGDWWVSRVEVSAYYDAETGRDVEHDISRAFLRGSKDPLAARIIGILESDDWHGTAIAEAVVAAAEESDPRAYRAMTRTDSPLTARDFL